MAPKKRENKKKREQAVLLENISLRATKSIGSVGSLIAHTIFFIFSFSLVLFGVSIDRVLLVLTTVLSLEAIYLAIFIQMTVNQNTLQLREVERDIEDLSEDIEEIGEDIEDIQEEMEDISEDIEEMYEHDKKEEKLWGDKK